MTARILEFLLQSDTVDRTPAAVLAANPNTFLNNAASSVPTYLYQSLKTIWLSASANPTQFANAVIADLGTGLNSPAGSIVIASKRIEEQGYDRSSFYSDQPGAETGPVEVILYKPRSLSTTIDQIQNARLRIRYLADMTIRNLRGLSPGIDVSLPQYYNVDLTVDYRFPVFFSFMYDAEPITASEATLVFKTEYVRLFSK